MIEHTEHPQDEFDQEAESDNSLDRIRIHALYDSLGKVIPLARDSHLTLNGFNQYCSGLIKSSVALEIVDRDPATFTGGTRKDLSKLQKIAQETRGKLTQIAGSYDEEELRQQITHQVINSPFVSPGVASEYFGLDYKMMYRAVAGHKASASEKSKSYPAFLPAERVGWQFRIPASVIFLYEGVGRTHSDIHAVIPQPEMQSFRDRLAIGDLTALDPRLGPMIYRIWNGYVTQQGLPLEGRKLSNLALYAQLL